MGPALASDYKLQEAGWYVMNVRTTLVVLPIYRPLRSSGVCVLYSQCPSTYTHKHVPLSCGQKKNTF